MLQGTGSDVGKSLLAAGLGRAFLRRGLAVRPFKPQNMSNNAAVTADGGEIGRAQALQARACGLAPSSDMNPVLLKPQTEVGAQVVVHGRVWGNVQAEAYQAMKPDLLPAVLDSFDRLSGGADLVLVEGAGSAAEVNLRAGDIANMGFAEAAGVPVVLVADIDRGGVIASLVGTHALLTPTERDLLAGTIINRFRGDVRLFDGGLEIIKAHTGLACFGVVPYFADAHRLPAEDALAVERPPAVSGKAHVRIAVPVFSRIANFDDLDPLSAEPDVEVEFVKPGRALPGGAEGWDLDIRAHLRRGGWLLGLCGGYQMLGRLISDPEGIEDQPGSAEGLGLLDIETTLSADKTLIEAEGTDATSGAAVRGYEMHVGATTGPGLARPMLRLGGRPDGAVSDDGRVLGCYLHGLFAADGFRHAFLSRLKLRAASGLAYETEVENTLDALARHLEAHLDLDGLLKAAHAR
jgi:adenosylcobyric acid synthase